MSVDAASHVSISKNGNTKVALITGITGQDGSYLAELLLDKGYEVHGIVRRASSFNTQRLDHIFHKLHLHYGDLIDSTNLCTIMTSVKPDEVYNLAAQSHVKVSFEVPEYTAATSGLGTLRLLEAIRTAGLEKSCRFYQASTSEMYGDVLESPQSETTPFNPRSPYGCAKVFAYWTVRLYRDSYGMFAVNGILFNHESPRRGRTFVTRKITLAIPRILSGKQDVLELGNLDALRDWGHAKDYVEAMWLMLQTETPNDFCIASGSQSSVRQFCDIAFAFLGVKLRWEGKEVDEKGICTDTGKVYVVVNPRYFRPCEVETLLGNCSKAKSELGWQTTITLPALIYDMLKADCAESGFPLASFEECVAQANTLLNSKI